MEVGLQIAAVIPRPDTVAVAAHQQAGTFAGAQGIAVAKEQQPDLILVDINMPDMNGLAFLRELSRKFPSTSVIMITAYGGVESYLEAMNLGAYEYLHKPVHLDELRSVMKKIFNGGSVARVS